MVRMNVHVRCGCLRPWMNAKRTNHLLPWEDPDGECKDSDWSSNTHQSLNRSWDWSQTDETYIKCLISPVIIQGLPLLHWLHFQFQTTCSLQWAALVSALICMRAGLSRPLTNCAQTNFHTQRRPPPMNYRPVITPSKPVVLLWNASRSVRIARTFCTEVMRNISWWCVSSKILTVVYLKYVICRKSLLRFTLIWERIWITISQSLHLPRKKITHVCPGHNLAHRQTTGIVSLVSWCGRFLCVLGACCCACGCVSWAMCTVGTLWMMLVKHQVHPHSHVCFHSFRNISFYRFVHIHNLQKMRKQLTQYGLLVDHVSIWHSIEISQSLPGIMCPWSSLHCSWGYQRTNDSTWEQIRSLL